MADGSSGNLGGVLFEAGKSVTDAGKQAAQKTAATVFQQVTGKQTTGGAFGNASTTPKNFPNSNNINNLGSLGGTNNPLEKLFGGKNPMNQFNQQQGNAQNQQQLQQMVQENKQQDNAKISQLQKQLHDEIYYNKIARGGNLARDRQKLAEEKAQEEQAKKDEEAAKMQQGPVKPGQLGGSLPPPVSQQPPSRNFEGSKPTG